MPYLQLDLEAKKAVPSLSRALRIEVHAAGWGLLELWEWCWNNKQTEVSPLLLRGFFGCQADDLGEVLAAFGFLEPLENGRFRVRGADKYLRITASRSAGGKKAAGNLKRGKSPGSSPAPAGSQPEDLSGSRPALTPNTEHRTPKQLKKPSAPAAPVGDYDELVQGLFDAFRAARGEDHLPTGRDWKALRRLRAKRTPAEILSKWRAGLVASYGGRMSTFSELETRWNNVAGADPPETDRPPCSAPGCVKASDAEVWGQPVCFAHVEAAQALREAG